jgi:hypothetical protein
MRKVATSVFCYPFAYGLNPKVPLAEFVALVLFQRQLDFQVSSQLPWLLTLILLGTSVSFTSCLATCLLSFSGVQVEVTATAIQVSWHFPKSSIDTVAVASLSFTGGNPLRRLEDRPLLSSLPLLDEDIVHCGCCTVRLEL